MRDGQVVTAWRFLRFGSGLRFTVIQNTQMRTHYEKASYVTSYQGSIIIIKQSSTS